MRTGEIFRAAGQIIKKLITNPRSIFLILKDERNFEKHLVKKYGSTSFPTVDIRYFVKDSPVEIKFYSFLEGGSLLTDLALLKTIASQFERCNYLEIGSWRGESIVNIAAVKNSICTSINLSPEEIIRRGFPEKYAHEHGVFLKDHKNIKQIHADSQLFDFTSLNDKFDLIFIDGDHQYSAVKSDTKHVFPLLRDDNSVLVWHDYAFDPVSPRHSVIAAIRDALPPEEHRYLYHVSNTMCAVYCKSETIRASLQGAASDLDKVFRVNIEPQAFQQ